MNLFKKVLISIVFFCIFAASANSTTVMGTVTSNNVALSQGYVTFTLLGCVNPLVNSSSGVAAVQQYTFTLDVNGNFPAATVTGNDVIYCSGVLGSTYYELKAFNQAGGLIWDRYYRITKLIWNIGTASVLTNFSVNNYVLTNPPGDQIINVPQSNRLSIVGGNTLIQQLSLGRDPLLPSDAATKNYVDTIVSPSGVVASVAGKVNRTGDSMTGPFYLQADPLNPLQAATKHYVDNAVVAGASTLSGTPTQCNASTQVALGIQANGNANCSSIPGNTLNVTGDVTITGASGAGTSTVTKVNGGIVPFSAAYVGTDSAGKIVPVTIPATYVTSIIGGTGITVSSPTGAVTISATGTYPFSSLTSSTNTTANMVVGSGSTLGTSGTGTISANLFNGSAVPNSAIVLGTNSGGIFVNNSSLVPTLGGNNTFTGINTFNATSSFASSITTGLTGLGYSSPGFYSEYNSPSNASLFDSTGPNSSTVGVFQFRQITLNATSFFDFLDSDSSGNATFHAGLAISGALTGATNIPALGGTNVFTAPNTFATTATFNGNSNFTGSTSFTVSSGTGPITINGGGSTSATSLFYLIPQDDLFTTKEFYSANHANSAYVWWVNDDGSAFYSTVHSEGFQINGLQMLSGIQGTTGTSIAVTTGTFTNGHLRSTSSTGDEVDAGLTASTVCTSSNGLCTTGPIAPTTSFPPCSTSGAIDISETVINAFDHEVIFNNLASCAGTANYTFVTDFSQPPAIILPYAASGSSPVTCTAHACTFSTLGTAAVQWVILKGW